MATVWQHGEAENCSGVKIADFGRSDAIVLYWPTIRTNLPMWTPDSSIW